MRRTKIVATIGPGTNTYDAILRLAEKGMNVLRLNLSYGDHEWHRNIIRFIRTINASGRYSIAVLLDTKGSEIRTGDLNKEIPFKKGDRFTFTIRRMPEYPASMVEVSYDGFVTDVKVGDVILVDSGMMSFRVLNKTGTDILTECLDGGVLTSRRHLNIRGKSSRAPTITKKDWIDIDFGIRERVDFIALSFVKDAKAVIKVKEYLEKNHTQIDVIAKIESVVALDHLADIVDASDGVMVARGDLGAEVPLEDVPLIQEKIIQLCREKNRPVIVATHFLESMIIHPTPTRAEVADIAQAVNERSDAIMLSGETASGKFPFHAIEIMDRVAQRIEKEHLKNNDDTRCADSSLPARIASHAASLANQLNVSAILVMTRRGYNATLLSQCRPHAPIYAFTNTSTVRRRLNLYWGVIPYRIEFSSLPERTIERALAVLLKRKLVKAKQKLVVVTDILVGKEFVETIQVRVVK